MPQSLEQITIATPGAGLTDITGEVRRFVTKSGIAIGLLTLFCRHTSASLVIQENADPDVLADLQDFFRRIAPAKPGLYRHSSEGADDMPAHLRAALTQTHLSIPVQDGKPLLGVWQAIYLFEHRAAPHRREIVLHLLG